MSAGWSLVNAFAGELTAHLATKVYEARFVQSPRPERILKGVTGYVR
jgi:hypothetical protein